MKTSWIIGVMMAYLVIFAVEMFLTGGTSFGATTSSGIVNTATANQSTLMFPELQESTNIFTAAWATLTGLGVYLKLVLQMLVLWSPTLFTGNLLWFWWFVCFPVDVGMVIGLIFVVRGVHSA